VFVLLSIIGVALTSARNYSDDHRYKVFKVETIEEMEAREEAALSQELHEHHESTETQ